MNLYNNVNVLKAPKGVKTNDYIRFIYQHDEPEVAKDKIFGLTYVLALKEIRKYSNIRPMEEAITDMAIAFMKTFNAFDPSNEEGSFMNYYKLAIRTEVLLSVYGKYKNTPEDRQFWTDSQNSTSSLNNLVEDKEGKYNEIGDILEDDYNLEDDIQTRELKNIMFDIVDRTIGISRIGKTHAEIFKTYIENKIYDLGMTTDEIGDMHGVTGNNVRKMIKSKKHLVWNKWVKETQI